MGNFKIIHYKDESEIEPPTERLEGLPEFWGWYVVGFETATDPALTFAPTSFKYTVLWEWQFHA